MRAFFIGCLMMASSLGVHAQAAPLDFENMSGCAVVVRIHSADPGNCVQYSYAPVCVSAGGVYTFFPAGPPFADWTFVTVRNVPNNCNINDPCVANSTSVKLSWTGCYLYPLSDVMTSACNPCPGVSSTVTWINPFLIQVLPQFNLRHHETTS